MSCYGKKNILTVVKIARQTLFRTIVKGVKIAIGKRGVSQLKARMLEYGQQAKWGADKDSNTSKEDSPYKT